MSQISPVVAQKSPIQAVLEEGETYAWCACGHSKTQPFCDGSHKPYGLAPVVFTAEKSGEHWLCGCKRTGTAPSCDGSHKSL
jgi:CDGSH-type Zn-finger protein